MAKKKRKTKKEELREEFNKKISEVEKEVNKMIKEKSILNNQRIGKKIDILLNDEFLKEIRGNGEPGILEKLRDNKKDHEEYNRIKRTVEGNGEVGLGEKLRNCKKQLWGQWIIIVFLVYLALGGTFRGINWNTIKEKLGISKTEIKQVESIDNI